MNKISVIVPIYNALDEVKFLLDSLIENFNFYFGEVLLINDCSKEDTYNYLNEFVKANPQFTLINNEENLGFVKTCNKGMKLAKGDIVILLNSDTMIPSGFCERIIKCFNSDEKIGIASPISSFSNAYYISMRKDMSLEDMNERLLKRHKCIYPQITTAEGFCYCIRKSVIDQIGYLDEIYGKGYGEESDYSCRASVNGWKNILIDDLYVYHKRCCSFGDKQRALLKQKNMDIYLDRYGKYTDVIEDNIDRKMILKIEKEMFPIMKYFYFGLSKNRKHYILNILGLKIKFKNKKEQ